MKRLRARWYLFGAQAVALYGAARATQDIDVTVLGDFEAKDLIAALTREGISPQFADAAFVAETRVVRQLLRQLEEALAEDGLVARFTSQFGATR
jgi:hypothetical protein